MISRRHAVEFYAALQSGAPQVDELRTLETGVLVATGPVLTGIDRVGSLYLLVPLGPDEAVAAQSISAVVSIHVREYLLEGRARRVLSLQLDDRDLERPFALLVEDLLDQLEDARQRPAEVVANALESWRELLTQARGPVMSSNKQAGLLAELHVLENLLGSGVTDPVRAWMGPLQGRHDFVMPSASVEVKATTNRDQFLVAIHGPDQLAPPEQGELWLYAEQVERIPAGGDCLADAVQRLLQSPAIVNHDFLQRLVRSGYVVAHESEYRTFRFGLLGSRLMRVGDDFPRITRDSLGPTALRVQHLQYSVDVGLEPASEDPVRMLALLLGDQDGALPVF